MTKPSREGVARLIDPDAWNLSHDDFVEEYDLGFGVQTGLQDRRREASLARADSILALLPAETEDVEWGIEYEVDSETTTQEWGLTKEEALRKEADSPTDTRTISRALQVDRSWDGSWTPDQWQDWLNEVTLMMDEDLWDSEEDQVGIIKRFVQHYTAQEAIAEGLVWGEPASAGDKPALDLDDVRHAQRAVEAYERARAAGTTLLPADGPGDPALATTDTPAQDSSQARTRLTAFCDEFERVNSKAKPATADDFYAINGVECRTSDIRTLLAETPRAVNTVEEAYAEAEGRLRDAAVSIRYDDDEAGEFVHLKEAIEVLDQFTTAAEQVNVTVEFRFTDEEWRTYQRIPDQGYSHRQHLEFVVNRRLRAANVQPDVVEVTLESGDKWLAEPVGDGRVSVRPAGGRLSWTYDSDGAHTPQGDAADRNAQEAARLYFAPDVERGG